MSDGPKREKVVPHSRPKSFEPKESPLESRLANIANQPLNPQIAKRMGAIRKLRTWLPRDLTSFAIGFITPIVFAISIVAAAVSEGMRVTIAKLLIWGIASAVIGLITGLCLVLGSFVVEHMERFRRWRLPYVVVLVIWVSLWSIGAVKTWEENPKEHRIAFACFMGVSVLPFAAILACIPLTLLGAITSRLTRHERNVVSGKGSSPEVQELSVDPSDTGGVVIVRHLVQGIKEEESK